MAFSTSARGKVLAGSLLLAVLSIPAQIFAMGKGDSSVSDVNVSANAAKTGGKAKVVFWMSMQTPERNTFMEGVLAQFREQNPDIELEFLGVPGDLINFKNKLDMGYASGVAPDVHDAFISELIARKDIQPLDKYFDVWSEKGKFSPSIIAELRSRDAQGGKLYAVPGTTVIRNFWIRPDWLKDKSLAMPTTWDEFFDVSTKLNDKAKGRYGHSIRGGPGGAQNLEYMMYSYSGITDTFTVDGKSTINDPLHVEFVKKYLGLYGVVTPEDDLNKGWTELAATFQSGTAASVFHNTGSAPSNDKAFGNDYSKYQVLTLPKSVKGYYVHPVVDPRSYAMSAKAQNPDAAWRLIAFLCSKEITSEFGKFYGELPLNKDAADAAWIKEKPYMVESVKFINGDDVKFFNEPTFLPSYRSILSKTAEPLMQSVMLKRMDAKEFLDAWAKELENAKAQYEASLKKSS